MIKQITRRWLEKHDACQSGIDWVMSLEDRNPINIIKTCIKNKQHLDWCNWGIVRLMTYKQYVSYAVYAAEQVLPIYEKEFPGDYRSREAIEAARACLKKRSKKNIAAAADAADAAAYASAAADADAAAYASAAAYAAAAAAAYATAYAAYAADAADAARDKIKLQIKILRYGLSLIKEE